MLTLQLNYNKVYTKKYSTCPEPYENEVNTPFLSYLCVIFTPQQLHHQNIFYIQFIWDEYTIIYSTEIIIVNKYGRVMTIFVIQGGIFSNPSQQRTAVLLTGIEYDKTSGK